MKSKTQQRPEAMGTHTSKPVILALRRLGQEYHKLQASLGYVSC